MLEGYGGQGAPGPHSLRHPHGIRGEPADIAAMALYLVLPEARYIDGAIMAVDGAMGAV